MSDTMPDFAEMARPVEAHDKLKPFVGTFHSEVRLYMGPGDPMVLTGTMVNEWDLGERFLKQTYTGDATEGPFPAFEGRGFWGYNKRAQRYEGYWIDNACTQMTHEAGTLDGNVWTMTGDMINPGDGQPMTKRTIITLQDNDHHTMVTYHSVAGGPETKSMEIDYVRK